MYKAELAKNSLSFTCINTKMISSKTTCYIPVKQMFFTWMKTFLHCGFG